MSRLCLLVATDAVGGVWQYSLDLADALRPMGVETIVALLGPVPGRETMDAAQRHRLIVTHLPLDWLARDEATLNKTGEALAALAGEIGAGIVQLSGGAMAASADFPCPVVAVQHSCVGSWWEAVRGTDLPDDFRWRLAVNRKGLARADAVVAPSRAFARTVARLHGLGAVSVVHNGRTVRQASRAARGDSDHSVFTAGRLWDEGKDLATLDAAAARLSLPVFAAGPLAGPNGARFRPRTLIPLGLLDDEGIAARLARHPIFVSTARYEPFGLAVLEAAASGCALVLSDIPTFRELWEGAALFVPPGDPDAFAAALGDVAGNAARRADLGGAAQERAARYTPRNMAGAMHAIYARLMSDADGPAELAGAL